LINILTVHHTLVLALSFRISYLVSNNMDNATVWKVVGNPPLVSIKSRYAHQPIERYVCAWGLTCGLYRKLMDIQQGWETYLNPNGRIILISHFSFLNINGPRRLLNFTQPSESSCDINHRSLSILLLCQPTIQLDIWRGVGQLTVVVEVEGSETRRVSHHVTGR
jgi:hypothetical protein